MPISLSEGIGRLLRRRRTDTPFAAEDPRPVIVHCSNHRVGTVWFKGIFNAVSDRYGIKMQLRQHEREPLNPEAGIIFQERANLPLDGLTDFRGSHMVRDPRDVVVSGYHYHLWTDEPWAHVPRERFGGKTYQEHIRGLDPPDGLTAELERLSRTTFKQWLVWDFHRPEFLELHYEDVIADEDAWFTRLFKHYGFREKAVTESVAIAARFSFKQITGRRVGEQQEGSHLRSGQPGQWREEFSAEHIALFKELTGDLLIRLGYEQNDLW